MEEKQKDLEKAWAKMELNSSYGISNIPISFEINNENKSQQILEDAMKTLNRIKIILQQ